MTSSSPRCTVVVVQNSNSYVRLPHWPHESHGDGKPSTTVPFLTDLSFLFHFSVICLAFNTLKRLWAQIQILFFQPIIGERREFGEVIRNIEYPDCCGSLYLSRSCPKNTLKKLLCCNYLLGVILSTRQVSTQDHQSQLICRLPSQSPSLKKNNTGCRMTVWICKGLCEMCACVFAYVTLRGCTTSTTVSFCVCLSVCPHGCLHEARPHDTQTLCCISPTAAARYLHRNVPPLTSPRERERDCAYAGRIQSQWWPFGHENTKQNPKTFLHFP